MANEIQFNSTLAINKRDSDTAQTLLIQRTYSCSYLDSMSGNGGPSPGEVTVNVAGSGGVQVVFAQLIQPKWCVLEHRGRVSGANQAGDYVNVGLYDTVTRKFYPMLELYAGMKLPVPLSRDLTYEYAGPGTGTGGLGTNVRLMLLAYPVAQKVSVEAFDR